MYTNLELREGEQMTELLFLVNSFFKEATEPTNLR